MDKSQFDVRLAQGAEDIRAAQRLRYEVFVEEMGARVDEESHRLRLEQDRFDPYFDHLLLIDNAANGRVAGVYRLMREDMAAAGIGYYGESEFDLSKLSGRKALELGRSCVAKEYRGGVGMHLLWDGLGDYVMRHGVDILFGVASFHGTKLDPLKQALSYLHQKYLAPEDLRVRSKAYVPLNQMDISEVNNKEALRGIPPLIKAYLRLGGFVGDGAYIDHNFNTVDVCLLMDTGRMVQKYRAFYARERS